MTTSLRICVPFDDVALSPNVIGIHRDTAQLLDAKIPPHGTIAPRGLAAFTGWAFMHRDVVPPEMPAACLGVPVAHVQGARGRAPGEHFGIVEWFLRVEFADDLGLTAAERFGLVLRFPEHGSSSTAWTCGVRSWKDATPFEVREQIACDSRVRSALVRLRLAPRVEVWASGETVTGAVE